MIQRCLETDLWCIHLVDFVVFALVCVSFDDFVVVHRAGDRVVAQRTVFGGNILDRYPPAGAEDLVLRRGQAELVANDWDAGGSCAHFGEGGPVSVL